MRGPIRTDQLDEWIDAVRDAVMDQVRFNRDPVPEASCWVALVRHDPNGYGERVKGKVRKCLSPLRLGHGRAQQRALIKQIRESFAGARILDRERWLEGAVANAKKLTGGSALLARYTSDELTNGLRTAAELGDNTWEIEGNDGRYLLTTFFLK